MPSTPSTDHQEAWGVARCACGHFTLRIGPLRLDLSAEEFVRLSRLLREADAHFLAGNDAAAHAHERDHTSVAH